MSSKSIVLFSPFESSLYVPLSSDTLEYNNLNNILFFLLLNNNTFTLFFLIILTPLFFTYLYSDRFINSSLYIEFILPFFLFCYNLFKNTVSKKKFFVFPFVCFLFFLLLMSNLTGLIPFNFALTSHLSSTFLLGFSVWFSVVCLSFYYSGLSFLSHFLIKGIPTFLVPILLFIEILSFFIRAISLSLRLFANIFSGHILLHVISGALYELGFSLVYGTLIPNFFGFLLGCTCFSILIIFEIVVSILQAYTFLLLSLLYLSEV